MKRIADIIEVEQQKGWPVRIYRAGRIYHVKQLVDYWVVQGRWWAREEKRVYFRVGTSRGVLELYRSGVRWVLTRLFD